MQSGRKIHGRADAGASRLAMGRNGAVEDELRSLVRFIAGQLGAEHAVLTFTHRQPPHERFVATPGADEVVQGGLLRRAVNGEFALERGPVVSPVPGNGTVFAATLVQRQKGAPGILALTLAASPNHDETNLLRSLSSYAGAIGLWLDDPNTAIGLMRSTYEDALTGCLSYPALVGAVRYELSRAERYGTPLACCFLDVDDFKAINDGHGHPAGNAVLVAVSNAVSERIREVDVLGRFGGDEFVLVLPNTNAQEATALAFALEAEVPRATQNGAPGPISVSVGIADSKPGMSADELLEGADTALREVKRQRGSVKR
jgi:diguanylate cyclase (GGDEF)-like protein